MTRSILEVGHKLGQKQEFLSYAKEIYIDTKTFKSERKIRYNNGWEFDKIDYPVVHEEYIIWLTEELRKQGVYVCEDGEIGRGWMEIDGEGIMGLGFEYLFGMGGVNL